MTAAFKTIECQDDRQTIVARIEVEPNVGKVLVYWMRTVVVPSTPGKLGAVLGEGRRAEPEDEVRLSLSDVRITRGAIPYIVTWCSRCRGELKLPIDWLLDEAKHSGRALCPTTVLPS